MRHCPNRREIGGICLKLELFGMGCSDWPDSLCIIEVEKREREKWPLSGRVQTRLASARGTGYGDDIACFVFDEYRRKEKPDGRKTPR